MSSPKCQVQVKFSPKSVELRRFALSVALALSFVQAASASDILIGDAKSQPESLTIAPGGVLIVGSASSPFIYKVKPGATTAEKFFDASAEAGRHVFLRHVGRRFHQYVVGMPADSGAEHQSAARGTLTLRSFDLTTGAAKIRWNLPGDNNVCNDFAIGPDKALYITDTFPGRIFRLAPGASTAEIYLENRVLAGVDGITFLDGVLYVNNVVFNKLYRIPVDAAGKPGTPVDIWIDQPIKGPDGMRAANGKLLVAENGSGKISSLTINGDKASLTVLKDGLNTPTGVEPAGDTIWIAERGAGKAVSIPMPK